MLVGLCLLAFNLQRFIEIIFTYVFVFFEKKSMKMLILKNLNAHRMRNKMTSIIYSVSLAALIYNVVSSKLQI